MKVLYNDLFGYDLASDEQFDKKYVCQAHL